MDAMSKSNMRVRLAGHVESVWIAKMPGSRIRGADHRQYHFACWNCPAVQFDVTFRQPVHPLQWRPIAQNLLDRRRKQWGGLAELRILVRVLDETQDRIVMRFVVVSLPAKSKS